MRQRAVYGTGQTFRATRTGKGDRLATFTQHPVCLRYATRAFSVDHHTCCAFGIDRRLGISRPPSTQRHLWQMRLAARDSAMNSTSLAGCSILICEDEPLIALGIADAFTGAGARVLTVRSLATCANCRGRRGSVCRHPGSRAQRWREFAALQTAQRTKHPVRAPQRIQQT